MAISHESHGLADRVGRKTGNVALDGAPKRVTQVPVHGGMHRTTGTNIGAPVTAPLSSIPDASNPLASDPTTVNSKQHAVPVSPGMRSRTSPHDPALGKAILAEAYARAEPDHPANLGRRA